MTTFKAGMIGIVLIVLFSYLAYTKFANPFASKFTVHALFSSANGLRPDSLVRIAGVNVGRVSQVAPVPSCREHGSIQKQCSDANVTMEIDPQGQPLHEDATFAIRPRIFLEGNFFVDISPGSPSAPTVKDGHTFPVNQGTEPVQFDQVLSSLQADTRKNLQLLLQGYGTGVKQGGPAYNASVRYWLPAYEYSAIVAHDALGIRPHDLSNWIAAQGPVAAAIDRNPSALKSLITDFNTTAGAFARENVSLSNAVAELPRTLNAAFPAFNALNAAFPPLERLSVALLPGVRSTGPTIDASLPFIHQLRLLVSPPELRGLTADLSVTVPALARLTAESIPFMRNGVRPVSSCVTNVIHPWSQLTLHDKHFNASNGFPPHKVYVEAVDFLPGLAGESRNFDANGPYIRILGALGNTVTQSLTPGMLGGALQPSLGAQPALPPGGRRPPLKPKVPCETQRRITTLDDANTTAPPPQVTSVAGLGGLGLPPIHLNPAAKKAAQRARAALLAALAKVDQQQGIKAPGLPTASTNPNSSGK